MRGLARLLPLFLIFCTSIFAADERQKIVDLVNRILPALDPNAPIAQAPSDQEAAALNASLKQLIELAGADFDAGVAKVRANKKVEDALDKAPAAQAKKIEYDATMLRREALRGLYLAHIALREVCTRGEKCHVDPEPAARFLQSIFTRYQSDLDDWELEWAPFEPEFASWLNVILAEKVRQHISSDADEAERAAMEITALPLDQYRDAAVRDQMAVVQLKTWAHLLRWRLELNSADSLARGLEIFAQFQEQARSEQTPRLDTLSAPGERGRVVGEIYISAARLYLASGDTARAAGLLSDVCKAKNPHAEHAILWLMQTTSASAADWSSQPVRDEPDRAMSIASAYVRRAARADVDQAKSCYLAAAVALRNGALGLDGNLDEARFVEIAPALFVRYGNVLAKCGMHQQAVAAEIDGLRLLSGRISAKANPWKNAQGQWTNAGEELRTLAKNALADSAYVDSQTTKSDRSAFHQDAYALVETIDPELSGRGSDLRHIVDLKNANDFAGALSAAEKYSQSYPKERLRALRQQFSIRLAWIASLKEEPKISEQISALEKTLARQEPEIDQLLAKASLDEAERKEAAATKDACVGARAEMLMRSKRYNEVLDCLGEKFWQTPPSDAEFGARMLSVVSQATCLWQEAELNKPEATKGPEALTAALQRLESIAAIFKKQAPIYEQAGCTASHGWLVRAAQHARSMAQAFAAHGVQPQEMDGLIERSTRVIIDHFTVTSETKPAQIFTAACMRWDAGEKTAAAQWYELYKSRVAADPVLIEYRHDADVVVKRFGAVLGQRQKLGAAWREIQDLLVDGPGVLDQYRARAVHPTEKKRDFPAALRQLSDFRQSMKKEAPFVGADGFAKMSAQLDALEELVRQLANLVTADSRLAQFYLESGRADQAVPLFETLYRDYDPNDERYAAGFVEGVLGALQHGKVVETSAIASARDVAVQTLRQVKQDATKRDVYWLAYIQYLELSVRLGDLAQVKERLSNTTRLKETPSDDLIRPASTGSDPRARIPRNGLSVDLARRFLALFEAAPGLKPSFRIEQLAGTNGDSIAVFVDAEAPAMRLRQASGQEGTLMVEEAK